MVERPISTLPGSDSASLDTPALVVDLDAFDANVNLVHGFFADRSANLRPSAHTHKTPALAHRQLAIKGSAPGIAVISISEAEVFASNGINDIRITTQIPTYSKLNRVAALSKSCKISLIADNANVVGMYSEAVTAKNSSVDVLVDINVNEDRPGVRSLDYALKLANLIHDLPGLNFAGIFSSGGPLGGSSTNSLIERDLRALDTFLDYKSFLQAKDIAVTEASFGNSTHNYALIGDTEGITEIRSGAYAFLDANHAQHCADLRHAAYIISTVNNRPEIARAVTDCGQKAIGRDLGAPEVLGQKNLIAAAGSAEHGLIDSADGSMLNLSIGDRVNLIPADISTTFSLHDIAYGIRGGIVDSVWHIAARGAFN